MKPGFQCGRFPVTDDDGPDRETSPKRTGYREIAAALRDAIADGVYRPGARLPSETQLISQYKVTGPTVRQAIRVLIAEGLARPAHGKGTFAVSAGGPPP
jgi:DNA-binding GntR family transcriptional regulator